MELFQAYHQHEWNFSSPRWWNEEQSLVPNLWSQRKNGQSFCSIWIFSPISDTSSKRNPGVFFFTSNTKLRRWLSNPIMKKKHQPQNSHPSPPPPCFRYSSNFHFPQRDIWHHNINLLAPRGVVCSVVAVLLRCEKKLFFHILTSKAPVMKREEPNLYQGKGRWGPKWFDQY